jgi:hypothetical protein
MPRSAAKNAPPAKSVRGNPETILQGKIMDTLGLHPGVKVWRNAIGTAIYESGAHVDYGVGGPGAPDLLLEIFHAPTCHWLAVWIEIKTPVGTVRPDQKVWHAAARRITRLSPIARNVGVARSVADALAIVAEVQQHGRVVSTWGIES